jgi:hypothetical protein
MMNKEKINWQEVIQSAESPEELLLAFLIGAPVDVEFIEAQRKLYEVCSKQNPWLN